MRPSFSIGIEEEYQTVDPVTRDLRSHIQAEIAGEGQAAARGARQAGDAPVGGRGRHGVCQHIKEARDDIQRSAPRR